jgi:hypothetical protein
MHYYPLYLLDSGVANVSNNDSEDYNYTHFITETKTNRNFPNRLPDLNLFMDKRRGYSALNDFIFSDLDFVVSPRVKNILEKHCLPPHTFLNLQLHREAKSKGVTKFQTHPYYWFYMNCEDIESYYNYIDFEKSEIRFHSRKNKENLPDIKINNIGDLYKIIDSNRSIATKTNEIYNRKDISDTQKQERCKDFDAIGWQAETLVMNSKFNTETDLFCLPLFSHQTYASKRLVQHFYGAEISGIRFGEIATKNPAVNNPGRVEIIVKGF